MTNTRREIAPEAVTEEITEADVTAIVSPSLDDMAPFLPREEFEKIRYEG